MSSDNQKHPLVYCGPMDVDACSLVDEEEEKADATTPVEQLETKNAPVACNAAGAKHEAHDKEDLKLVQNGQQQKHEEKKAAAVEWLK